MAALRPAPRAAIDDCGTAAVCRGSRRPSYLSSPSPCWQQYFAPAISAPTENKRTEQVKDDGLPVDIKLPVKHILSRELQMYFDKIAELTMSRSSTPIFREALVSLSKDSGLHPLVPYFSYFIVDEVTRSLADLPILFALMRVVQSLLCNPHIHIEPYGNILNRKSKRTTRKLLTTVTGAKGDESEFDSINAPLEPQTWEGSFLCGCAL